MNPFNKVLLSVNVLMTGTFVTLIVWRSHSAVQESPVVEVLPQSTEKIAAPVSELRAYSALATTADWRQWLDQLRALGVPSPVLARLARAGFEDRWQKRQAQTYAAYLRGDISTEGLAAFDVQHDRDEENEMRAALGDAEFKHHDMEIVWQSLPLHDVRLTPLESESLYDIEKGLQHLAQDLHEARLKGQMSQDDYEARLRKAQAERNERVSALLGEERYLAMYPPLNGASEKLRKDLQAVEIPADVSFDALVEIQNRWNERRVEVQGRLQEARSQEANFENELLRVNNTWEIEFERVLGKNTFDAAQKEGDARYQAIKRQAGELSLDGAAMDYVYRGIRYYEKAIEGYQQQMQSLEAKGEAVDRETMTKNIRQFAWQTQQALQNYLGQARFNQLKTGNILPFVSVDSPATN